jgi:uncharacterized membrane protein YjgN (DUF898 family)
MEPTSTAGTVTSTPQPLRFTGTGSEYFGIWTVNLLLTIVTLGIYSAWAKVRRIQFFYRHTELAGSSFDFHGSPLRILFGRVLALGLFLLYNYSVRLHSPLTVAVLVGLALLMPWLLRNSFRFRLYNASWRGTRFHFRGSLAGAYRVFLLNGVLTAFTLYLLAPFMHQRLKAYQHDNSWFGQTRCSFHASVGQFYRLYLLLLGLLVGVAIAVFALGAGSVLAALLVKPGEHVDTHKVLVAVVLLYAIVLVLGACVGPAFRALITNLVWNHTRIGEHRIECNISPLRFVWITASNLVLIVLTLGFYIPWAMVRIVRYQVESIRLIPAGDLDAFAAAEPEKPGAVGEEAAAVFDFDIAL